MSCEAQRWLAVCADAGGSISKRGSERTMAWTADITNDPTRNFELYVELLEDDRYRARLRRSAAGELERAFYGGEACQIPWTWLSGIVSRFEQDVPRR